MPDKQAQRLAELLRAIETEKTLFAELRKNHKEHLEKLQHEVGMLREEILSGQTSLLMEPEPEVVA